MDSLTIAGFSVILTSVFCFAAHTVALTGRRREVDKFESTVRELEKAIHVAERRAIEEKNELLVQFHDDLKQAKVSAYSEGHRAGEAEKVRDLQVQGIELESKYRLEISREREIAANEARETARREFEMQTKMFSVLVRPYVRVKKISGFITDSFKSETGYQYQLLVNGIPAFQPHVVVDSTEETKTVNEDNVRYLIEKATEAAKIAVSCVGGFGPHVTLANAVVDRDTK